MSDDEGASPRHADGRLRHRAAPGALQPQLPGAGPAQPSSCVRQEREYAGTDTVCPDCGGKMQHLEHRVVGDYHFDHDCIAGCRLRFRDPRRPVTA